MTLKQLQAFLWVTRMGTFAAAAKRLHTTQSTISARVMELETSLGVRVFDRASTAARLTAKGRELLPLAERLLSLESQIESTVGDPKSLSGVVKVGVAEFVALSWLPNWVAKANQRFPNVILEMDVDLTLGLQQKLAEGALDLALLPGPTPDSSLVQKNLGAVTFCWMASPHLGVPPKVLDAKDLEAFPIILLSSHSNLHAILKNWFELSSASPRRVDLCNSLATIASLTMAGLGISFLPLEYHRADIRAGRLAVVQSRPAIPPLTYVAAYRVDRPNSLVGPLSDLAVSLSTFKGKAGFSATGTSRRR
jgi:DNA-binding transcriptional LysR family regulator